MRSLPDAGNHLVPVTWLLSATVPTLVQRGSHFRFNYCLLGYCSTLITLYPLSRPTTAVGLPVPDSPVHRESIPVSAAACRTLSTELPSCPVPTSSTSSRPHHSLLCTCRTYILCRISNLAAQQPGNKNSPPNPPQDHPCRNALSSTPLTRHDATPAPRELCCMIVLPSFLLPGNPCLCKRVRVLNRLCGRGTEEVCGDRKSVV